MSFKYSTPRKANTPVKSKIAGREKEMIENDGGGMSFKLDDFKFLDRFLILGATHGTYYVSKETHQERNFSNIINCIKNDGVAVVERIVDVSTRGLAQKNDHAIYALALVFTHGNDEAKRMAKARFSEVVRTGTHLFMFCDFIKSMRGFGKVVREAINNWYNEKTDYGFALQVSKYQQREGWSHKDVFRLAHPRFGDGPKNTIAKWAMGQTLELDGSNDGERLLRGVEMTRLVSTDTAIVKLIKEYQLQREHIPTVYLNLPKVQEALLPHMGATALLRNLGNMSKSGLLSDLSSASKFVVERLTNKEWIKKGKLHPLSILVAKKVYESGRGMLGDSTWRVNGSIASALEDAFYLSFETLEPTGKNFFYGLDVSGSMGGLCREAHMTYCEIAAVLAMAHVKCEKNTFVGGFSSQFRELKITRRDSLSSAAQKAMDNNFGSTNPASAIEYAMKNKMNVDCFVFITDNDVNSGRHTNELLENYRRKYNKNAKMIVCGLVPTPMSIADPKDLNSLDIAGFSADLPSVINSFVSM